MISFYFPFGKKIQNLTHSRFMSHYEEFAEWLYFRTCSWEQWGSIGEFNNQHMFVWAMCFKLISTCKFWFFFSVLWVLIIHLGKSDLNLNTWCKLKLLKAQALSLPLKSRQKEICSSLGKGSLEREGRDADLVLSWTRKKRMHFYEFLIA